MMAEVHAVPAIGKVFGKKPTVQIERGSKRIELLFSGERVVAGDKVTTNSKGQAQIMLAGGNVIYLAPGSSIHLSRKIVEQEIHRYDLTLKGKILAKVNLSRKRRTIIRTANAIIGVRGTEFIVEYVEGFTTVGVLKGNVEITDLKSNKTILVNKGQMSIVSASSDLVVTKITDDLYQGLEFSQLIPDSKHSLIKKEPVKKKIVKKEPPLIKQESKPVVIEKRMEPEADSFTFDSFLQKSYSRYSDDLIWHVSTVGTLLVSAYLSMQESSSYDSLSSENNSLKSQSATASESEYNALNTQFEVNQSKMEQHKQNILLYNNITYLAIAFEGYLLLFPPQATEKQNMMSPKVSFRNNPTLQKAEILLNWKF